MDKTPYIGQRVVVVGSTLSRARAYESLGVLWEAGDVVREMYSPRADTTLFGVRLDKTENPKSADGLFYFHQHDLATEKEYEQEMEYMCDDVRSTKIIERWFSRHNNENDKEENTMLPGYKTASIQFLDGPNKNKTYFYALYDESIQPNDLVVVSTGHHGLALARVAFIGGPASYVDCNREIVCKADTSAWEARKEKAVKAKQLKEDMDARVKEFQATALYDMVAEKDPALKALLDQYKALMEG